MGLLSDLYYGETNFDFPKWWRRALILSAVLIVASVLALVGRGLNLGIDFEGGTSWDVAVGDASVSDARDVLRPLGEAEAKIQVVDGDMLRIQSAEDDPAKVAEITAALGTLGEVQGTQSVGPSWGEEITEKAIRALVVFFVLLALFMAWRLEWKMAIAAIVAVVHDIIISVGVYAVFQIPVTPATVVSFLTILGYSLYDTIVVFDKVLELTSRTAIVNRYTYTDIVSHGLNRVLMRSLNTTIMGVLPVLAMLIVGRFLGAETLLDFAVALLVGLIVGAYSSIFVAAPILAKLKEREPRHRTVRDRLARGAEGGRSRPSAIGTDDLVGAASGRRTPAVVGGGQAGPGSTSPSSPSSASPSSGSRPAPSGTIPPRPRKKKRR
jgi:preprotein translocase subunit SecF